MGSIVNNISHSLPMLSGVVDICFKRYNFVCRIFLIKTKKLLFFLFQSINCIIIVFVKVLTVKARA